MVILFCFNSGICCEFLWRKYCLAVLWCHNTAPCCSMGNKPGVCHAHGHILPTDFHISIVSLWISQFSSDAFCKTIASIWSEIWGNSLKSTSLLAYLSLRYMKIETEDCYMLTCCYTVDLQGTMLVKLECADSVHVFSFWRNSTEPADFLPS